AASSLAPRSSPCPPCFCFPDPAPPDTYTLSLHDALPISLRRLPAPDPHRRRGLGLRPDRVLRHEGAAPARPLHPVLPRRRAGGSDRKSTRLNSSHVKISYAVFCLKKKKKRRARERSGDRA